jgi:superkiller protein 3
LGAGGEKEVRRAVGTEWLNKSKVEWCLLRDKTITFTDGRIFPQLPRYYEMILNHPVAPDDVRRSAESKLFRHWYRLMASLSRTMTQSKVDQTASNAGLFDPRPEPPLPSKDSVKEKVLEMMKGMILLDVEDEAVWGTSLEWNDAASLGECAFGVFCRIRD